MGIFGNVHTADWLDCTADWGFGFIGLFFYCTYNNMNSGREQALCVRTLKTGRMNKRTKLGRPPLPEGDARGARLYCRLLPSEVDEIERAAQAAKKEKSTWIREALLTAARQPGKNR
jgi:hypothetical protein